MEDRITEKLKILLDKLESISKNLDDIKGAFESDLTTINKTIEIGFSNILKEIKKL